MKSYIKFLSRNKLYTAIEAVGLTVSLAFVILIGTYVVQQYRIAYENPDYERIYSASNESFFGGGYFDRNIIDDAVPEAEVSARYSFGVNAKGFSVNNEVILAVPAYLEKEFFDIFPYYDILEGSADVLDDPSNVIVSRTFANKISSAGESVIGMQLRYPDDPDKVFNIAAVMEDFDKTLFSYSDVIFNIRETGLEQYGFNTVGSIATFFRVTEGSDRNELQEKLRPLYDKNYGDWVKPKLYRLDEIYFLAGANMTNKTSASLIRILLVVVLALLMSAVFNYINLTFALNGKRAKEMATRRLIGADKIDIFIKSIFESVVFTLLCLAAALLLAVALVPVFNSLLVGNQDNLVPLSIELKAGYAIICVLSAFILGAVSGLIPALNTLRFKPIDVIKGSFRSQDKKLFTKIFIVVQSALSMILITMAILMEVQLSHMLNRPMNARMDNLYFMYVGSMDASDGRPLIDRLERLPEVNAVGIGSGYPGGMNMSFGMPLEDGKTHVMVQTIICDSTYLRLLEPETVEDFNYPLSGSVWMGEATAAAVELNDDNSAVIARKFSVNGAMPAHVGGIFRDIPTGPATQLDMNTNGAFVVERIENIKYNFALLISTTSESQDVVDRIMDEYYAYAHDVGRYEPPFMSFFLTDSVRKSLAPVMRTIRLVELFMLLAILLSSLGLIAMSTYFSEQKSKEIAVRKVFGGTIGTETLSNVRNYMIMVLIASFIGVPIAVCAAGRYLEQFPYKIENYWWIFVIAVVISFAISLLSVLWQTLKAARTNPATELKKE